MQCLQLNTEMAQRIIQKKSSGSPMLPCLLGFFRNFILSEIAKMVFKGSTLVSATAIYQTKCPFTVLSALFCSSGCCPMILDYSLWHKTSSKSGNMYIKTLCSKQLSHLLVQNRAKNWLSHSPYEVNALTEIAVSSKCKYTYILLLTYDRQQL